MASSSPKPSSAAAGCGIWLDLPRTVSPGNALNAGRHERRQVSEGQIPLDRVWEIHVAGGMEMDGFWLDGHCDVLPHRLLEIARRVLPALPNVKAMIFRDFPIFYPGGGYR